MNNFHLTSVFVSYLFYMEYTWPAKVGNKPILLSPLVTDEERKKGFQYCKMPPKDFEGALFVFESESSRTFHMKNVNFDLDLLGFNSEGLLIFCLPMKCDSGIKYNTLPCKYVIEAPADWSRGLSIGLSKLFLY